MKCPHCKLLLDVPSEVLSGRVRGVCSACHNIIIPLEKPKPTFVPDIRGRPSIPGGRLSAGN